MTTRAKTPAANIYYCSRGPTFFHGAGAPSPAPARSLSTSRPFSVVGVTPPNFFGVDVGRIFDVILPLNDEPLLGGRDHALNLVSGGPVRLIDLVRIDEWL